MLLVDRATLRKESEKIGREKLVMIPDVEKYSLWRISDEIYFPKRLGHDKILVYNFQTWDISNTVSAM